MLDARGLTLQGAVGEDGEPATVLVGYNDEAIHGYLPSILWCENNENLSLLNLAFTREREFASAGVVIARMGINRLRHRETHGSCLSVAGELKSAGCMWKVSEWTGKIFKATGYSSPAGFHRSDLGAC